MTSNTPHLWEIKHPYYCEEGNYYANGNHLSYGSWSEFHAEWGSLDQDYNAVFRWDWKRPDPEDLEEGDDPGPDKLFVYWVLQLKAILRSTECVVTEDDEPAVRAWLTERARHTVALWSPLIDPARDR